MAKAKILVVEDEGIVAKDIKNTLKRLGYAVCGILFSGDGVIGKVEETQPDLVLMDIVLGGEMDGVEVAEQIRDRFGIPVVYLTAYADDETLRRAKITVPYGYILKPFQERELHTVIEVALCKHEMEKTLRERDVQLLQAQKMEAVGRLAGGVAHDFNNLLTVILGTADLAMRNLPHDSLLRHDFQEIRNAGERAATLTRQLLAFARKQIITPKILDLNELILNMGKMLRRLIEEDVEFVILPGPHVGQVEVDPGQLEQVLVNLVVNARDAMPDGGKLLIETDDVTLDDEYARSHVEVTSGDYVLLAISDTGTGMTEEVLERCFEPFFTTKEVGKGTGLGLATAYGIVKQNGGHIEVESEVGRGTTFTIYLPRVEEDVEIAQCEEVENLLRGAETVVVVEDDPTVRATVVRLLLRQGYTVIEAPTGEDALHMVLTYGQEVHLLVTDVVMPQMNGRILAEQMALLRPNIKVLFISGYTNDAISHYGVLAPEAAFLQKPFTLDVLAHKVREVLDA